MREVWQTLEMKPEKDRVIMPGLQSPSDNFIVSPMGAEYLFGLWSTEIQYFPYLYFETFLMFLLTRVNLAEMFKLKFFSFSHHFLQLRGVGGKSNIHSHPPDDPNHEFYQELSDIDGTVFDLHVDSRYNRGVSETGDT